MVPQFTEAMTFFEAAPARTVFTFISTVLIEDIFINSFVAKVLPKRAGDQSLTSFVLSFIETCWRGLQICCNDVTPM